MLLSYGLCAPAPQRQPAKSRLHPHSNDVGFREVDITEVPAAFEYITSDPADGGLGYSQAPVVVNDSDDEDHWSGHRMDKLIQAARQAA